MEHIGDLSTARMPFNFQSKYLLIPALDLVPKANQQTKLYKNMTVGINDMISMLYTYLVSTIFKHLQFVYIVLE